ncbi:MAG: hypothetical protein ABIB47_02490 [Candidatus Woesearchaeota archaeon]
MRYRIEQNPEYDPNGKVARPLLVHGPNLPPRKGSLRRNLTGTANIVRGHEVILEESTFSDSKLLKRLQSFLNKKSIEFTLV